MSELLPIFVYGTLRRGECRAKHWPHPPLRIGTAFVRGRLHNLGSYPAMVAGNDRIGGELWDIAAEQLEETLRALDAVEGCVDGSDDEYVREVVNCETESGDRRRAYVYRYADPAKIAAFPLVAPSADGVCWWRSNSDV